MKASEAKALAIEVKEDKDEFQLTHILEKIKIIAEDGDFSLVIDNYLRQGTINSLRELGYEVKQESHRNEEMTIIKW